MQALGNVTGLVSLSLCDVTAQGGHKLFLDGLSTLLNLTRLKLGDRINLTEADTAFLMNLTQLHTLELVSSVTYSPAVLECCTRLQRLVISSPNVHVSDVSVPGAGRAAMMAALPRLQQLQESTITLIGGHGQLWGYPSPEDTSAVASYSALTSSTNLHTLELTGMPMDARALPALFQKGHQLPALHTLILAMSMDTWAPPPATDMQQLVCCCPALRRLHLSHCRVGAELLQPLLQLSCLTELHVPRCDALGDDGGSAMSKVLAQLTQLSHLLVGTGVSDVAITELTALTGLTALCRTGGGFPHDLMMINKVGSCSTVLHLCGTATVNLCLAVALHL